MLRQCNRLDQKDWATKLPAVELAMNMGRSDTTVFSLFYLNYSQMPHSLVWESESEYPGVTQFAQRMKEAIMAAHDAIIAARMNQLVQVNKHRRPVPFKVGDFVYLSTCNLSILTGRARKLRRVQHISLSSRRNCRHGEYTMLSMHPSCILTT